MRRGSKGCERKWREEKRGKVIEVELWEGRGSTMEEAE